MSISLNIDEAQPFLAAMSAALREGPQKSSVPRASANSTLSQESWKKLVGMVSFDDSTVRKAFSYLRRINSDVGAVVATLPPRYRRRFIER